MYLSRRSCIDQRGEQHGTQPADKQKGASEPLRIHEEDVTKSTAIPCELRPGGQQPFIGRPFTWGPRDLLAQQAKAAIDSEVKEMWLSMDCPLYFEHVPTVHAWPSRRTIDATTGPVCNRRRRARTSTGASTAAASRIAEHFSRRFAWQAEREQLRSRSVIPVSTLGP
jgi:hypothetical protein